MPVQGDAQGRPDGEEPDTQDAGHTGASAAAGERQREPEASASAHAHRQATGAPGPVQAPRQATGAAGPAQARQRISGTGEGGWPAPPAGTAVRPPQPGWFDRVRAAAPAPVTTVTLWAALASGLVAALVLADGLGVNLLLVALPAAVAAWAAARRAKRGLRPWTVVWAVAGLALLAVPALRDAGWPVFLAVAGAFAMGALALNGGRSWAAVLFAPLGLCAGLAEGLIWGVRGVRERFAGSSGRLGPVLRGAAVAVVLLVVFGALFAGADAAFADLLGNLIPDLDEPVDGPLRLLMFALGVMGALAAARTAAAPVPWDRTRVPAGRPRGRTEWAMPLVVLTLLFAAFNAVQLTVLFGGYDAVLRRTGLSYADYARQGFWQLLIVTLLFLVVVVVAARTAPRSGPGDRLLVRGVLGVLCALALVVVASAVTRMNMYVDAYGLTRLRISVLTMEFWLGLVIVLIMVAGIRGSGWLPRAVAVSAAAGVLTFGLMSPDALIAEHNVARYTEDGKLDRMYLEGLSVDAVPALDRLREPVRSCLLAEYAGELDEDTPWYATSWSERQARSVLAERPVEFDPAQCVPPRERWESELYE
ncbi:DUF4153 domain-containing protein [Streptomyces sp. NPDC047130]|uniref:DUF4153 domain-containing protein n=1 Tax=Streptomyces sp. NPDC047130 TaxID=3155261 RepID=UPI00341144AE